MSGAAGRVRVVITGGGTGGHVFPGLALAAGMRSLCPKAEISFIGNKGRIEARLVPAAGWPFTGITARGLKGLGYARTLANAMALPLGLLQSFYHLIRFWPRLVVGMGGYVAGPVVTAAWVLRRKIAIHEQNLTPGWTNRLLARFSDLIMVSFAETARLFPTGKVLVTGNPVREAARGEAREETAPGKFLVLVLGGSQGASSLNRMMVEAAAHLDRQGLEIAHQTGAADLEWVSEAYRSMGITAEVAPFIEEVGRRYAWADLVVSRAGATTIAELAANGRPAVLVPFPGATEGHQEENARWLADQGAALRVEDRGKEGGRDLAEAIGLLRSSQGSRLAMAEAAKKLSMPQAAADMARACLELAGR